MNKSIAWPLAALFLLLSMALLTGCPKKPAGTDDTLVDTSSGSAAGQDPAADGSADAAAGADSTASSDSAAAGIPVATAAPAVGSPAPDFSFTSLDGKALSLGAMKGKPVVVNFWATWCGPCKAEFPDFQTAYNANKGRFELISFALASSEDPSAYVAEQKLGWTFAWDQDEKAADIFKPLVVPLTVFINKEGLVTASYNRKMEKAEFDSELAKIL